LKKLIVCAALLCVAFARAQGQGSGGPEFVTPPFVRLGDAGAEAARLLKSYENRERAWGAYLVGLHGWEGQTPSLVSILEDENLNGGGEEAAAVRQAALDALIRLDAEVPAEALVPLYASAPDEVLILLARSPEKNQRALLTLFTEDTSNVRWLAAGNLLAQTRAPGFVARLLAGLKIKAGVNVYESEGDHRLFGGGRNDGGGCGGGTGPGSKFPPVGYYKLDDGAYRGATVLATGPRVIHYRRKPYRSSCLSGADWLDRDSMRVEYLEELLRGGAEMTNFDDSLRQDVVCKDTPQCLKALAGARDRVRRAYDALLRRLLAESLLDGAEAAELKPDITLDITDMRESKSSPLPDKLGGAKLTFTSYEAETEGPAADEPEPIVYGPPIIPPR
jgi:hypothetical protein